MNIINDLALLQQIQSIQNNLNSLIEAIHANGGKVWLQDFENKDLHIVLSKPMRLSYYYICEVEK